ncbi:MAG: VIT1/CCC1 transporter family protein [Staphylothermus sp.]|nr:VIT1/CCC1 transporter family protein [Staphylothermus sp.]
MEFEELLNNARKALMDELYAAAIYTKLSRLYRNKKVSSKLRCIAEMESRHAVFWAKFLKKRGFDTSKIKINHLFLNTKILFYRIIGYVLTLKLLENEEKDAVLFYSKLLDSNYLFPDEKDELKRIIEDELLHEQEIAEEEEAFKDFMEHIRDAVLGMSDGLVEVLSVAAGLAGVYGDPFNVAVGGTIVGIAGALSMGIGSYTSVKAQREVRIGVLEKIKLIVKYVPQALFERVKKHMVAKGFNEETAIIIAKESMNKEELLSKIISVEEYGLTEERLEDPVKAGLYTGIFYILGGIIPLIPYYLRAPVLFSLPASFIIAALLLGGMGFVIAVIAEINIKKKMLELILAGIGSATLTFIIGKLASLLLGVEVG